jgi:hypothetical protein
MSSCEATPARGCAVGAAAWLADAADDDENRLDVSLLVELEA